MIDRIRLFIERIRDELDMITWKYSPENRLLVHQRLKEHDEAMKKGEPGPYFGDT